MLRSTRFARTVDSRCYLVGATLALVGFAPVSSPLGCSATKPRPAESSPANTSPSLAPDVDPARAFVALDQIPPPVARPPAQQNPPLSERGARQLAKARSLVAEQRFAEAVIELERAERFDPNHPDVEAALATLQWQAGNAERARGHAAAAVAARPDMAEAHYILGRCAAATDDVDAALIAYRMALLCSDISASPALEALTRFHLAESLTKAGYLTAALEQHERLAKVLAVPEPQSAPEWRALAPASRNARVDILERLGRFADAATALSLNEAEVGEPAVAKRRARLLARAGQTDEALRIARSLPSDDPDALELLRDIHTASSSPDALLTDLRAMMASGTNGSKAALMLADALTARGQPSEAAAALRDYVSTHPDDETARLRWADLAWRAGDDMEFIRVLGGGVDRGTRRVGEYDQRLTMAGGDRARAEKLLDALTEPEGTRSAGECYATAVLAAALGRTDRVEPALRRSLEIRPELTPARLALARHYFEQQRYDDVLTVARQGKDDLPEDASLVMLLGEVFERLDDYEQAERAFRLVTQLDRSRVDAMFELARVYKRTDRENLAQRQLRLLLEQQPDHEAARELLALMHLEDGKPDVAYAQIEELKRRTSSPTTAARCDSVLDPQLRRDPSARRAQLLTAIEQTGGDAVSWNGVAQSYDEFDPASARAAYARSLTFDPLDETALRGITDACRGELDFEAAAKHLELLLRIRPNRHNWRQELVGLWLTLQDYDKALAIARAEAERSNLDASTLRGYRLLILESLRAAKRPDDLLAQLQTWTQDDPEDVEAAKWLGDELLKRDRAAEAAAVFETLVQRDDRNWSLLGSWVEALGGSGRWDAAAQRTLDRLEQDRENDTASYILVTLMAHSGHAGEAMEYVRTHLLRTFNREAFQEFLIERLRQDARHGEAVDYIERLMNEAMTLLRATREARRPLRASGSGARQTADQPNDPFTMEGLAGRIEQLRVSLGLALIGAERARDAEERVTGWLETSDDGGARARLLWLLALAQRAQRDEDGANETIRRALAIAPDNVSLNNDVAYGWINAGERLDEAERMIRFALSRSPREAAYLDTYGWLLYKKARFSEAKLWLERARRASENDDPVLLDHLGDACWRLGEKEAAITHWTKSLELMTERRDEQLLSADDRRVRDEVPKKLNAARSAEEPPTAPLGRPIDGGKP